MENNSNKSLQAQVFLRLNYEEGYYQTVRLIIDLTVSNHITF